MDINNMTKEELIEVNTKLIKCCDNLIVNNEKLSERLDEMVEVVMCYHKGDLVGAAEIIQRTLFANEPANHN